MLNNKQDDEVSKLNITNVVIRILATIFVLSMLGIICWFCVYEEDYTPSKPVMKEVTKEGLGGLVQYKENTIVMSDAKYSTSRSDIINTIGKVSPICLISSLLCMMGIGNKKIYIINSSSSFIIKIGNKKIYIKKLQLKR